MNPARQLGEFVRALGAAPVSPAVVSSAAEDGGKVVCVSSTTSHRFGNVLEQQFRLRYEVFLKGRYWEGLSSYRGLEYDEYDTPAAHYLVRLAIWGDVHGTVRLSPTDRPYMLREKWPEMCSARTLPSSMSTWEVTRLCVNQTVNPEYKRLVKNELVCALLEFGLENDVQEFIGVMHPKLWGSVFAAAGWEPHFVGTEKMLGDGVACAATLPVTPRLLRQVRETVGIDYSVLRDGFRLDG